MAPSPEPPVVVRVTGVEAILVRVALDITKALWVAAVKVKTRGEDEMAE